MKMRRRLPLRARSRSTRAAVAGAAFACALGGATASPARAEPTATPRPASLGWTRLEGAEGCIGAGDLARAVEALLGKRAFVSVAEAELSIEGRVAPRAEGGFQASLEVADRNGQSLGRRDLDNPSSDCRALDEPLRLAIALMIDPEGALGAPPPPPAPNPPPASAPPEPPPPAAPLPAVPPAPTPWRGDLALGAIFAFGLLPSAAPGLVLSASLEPPWFVPLESVLSVYLPQSTQSPAGLEASLFTMRGEGYVCPLAHVGDTFGARACVGGELGLLSAEGAAVDDAEEGLRVQLGVGLRGRVGLRVAAPLGFYAAGGVVVRPLREGFATVDEAGAPVELFRPSLVNGALELGAELGFP
jgi:hypothetical protein